MLNILHNFKTNKHRDTVARNASLTWPVSWDTGRRSCIKFKSSQSQQQKKREETEKRQKKYLSCLSLWKRVIQKERKKQKLVITHCVDLVAFKPRIELPIPTLWRLKEGLTEWFADRQTNETARSKAQAKTPESSQGNIKEYFWVTGGIGVAQRRC